MAFNEASAYRLFVSLAFKNEASAGLKGVIADAKKAKANVDAIKKALQDTQGKYGPSKSSIDAQRQLYSLQQKELDLRKKLTLTQDMGWKKRYAAELTANKLVQQEVENKKKELALEERIAGTKAREDARRDRALRKQWDDVSREASRQTNMQIQAERRIAREQAKIQAEGLARQKEARAQMAQVGAIVAGGIAYGTGRFIRSGINAASDYQSAMTNLALSTGTSGSRAGDAATRTAMANQSQDIAGLTAQSDITIAQEMAKAATSGLNNPKQLMAMMPQMAMLADNMMRIKGQDPVETIMETSQIAHFLQSYGGEKGSRGYTRLGDVMDEVQKTMLTQPEQMQNIITQGKYYMPLAHQMGMSDKEIMDYTGLMAQMGFLQGRGGTSVKTMLNSASLLMADPAKLTKGERAKVSYAHDLGLTDSKGHLKVELMDKNGTFHLQKMIDAMSVAKDALIAREGKSRGLGDAALDIKHFFGENAEPLVIALIDKAARDRMKANQKAKSGMDGVEPSFQKLSDQYAFQEQRAGAQYQKLLQNTFGPALPSLTEGLKALGNTLGGMSDFMRDHKDLGIKVVYGSMVLFGGASVATAAEVAIMYRAVRSFGLAASQTAVQLDADALAARGATGALGGAAAALQRLSIIGTALTALGMGSEFAVQLGAEKIISLQHRDLENRLKLDNPAMYKAFKAKEVELSKDVHFFDPQSGRRAVQGGDYWAQRYQVEIDRQRAANEKKTPGERGADMLSMHVNEVNIHLALPPGVNAGDMVIKELSKKFREATGTHGDVPTSAIRPLPPPQGHSAQYR